MTGAVRSVDEPGSHRDSRVPVAAVPATDCSIEDAYREHAAVVLALARRLLGDDTQAEDVTQEVFVRLWRRPERFDPTRGCLRTFLLTDCHGRSIDAIRSESSRRRREERHGRSSNRSDIQDVTADVCERAVHRDIKLLIKNLPDGERDAIALAFTEQLTYRHVAGILGLPEGTVKGRIRSGLRRLRGQMQERDLAD